MKQLSGLRKTPVPTPRRKTGTSAARSFPSNASAAVVHPATHARLRVAAPHDHCEREANCVADAVMRMPQRGAGARATTQGMTGGIASLVGDGVQSLNGRGRALSQPMREFFDRRFGHDFGHVRIHTDAHAADLAESIQARAFTVGRDIVFGAGEYAPDTSRGRELMAHELTHVAQQERGAAHTLHGTIRRQPKTESAEFPDFPNLALKIEDDIGQNLFDYGHHFYRLATLYPDRPELLQEAFGRYALGANVLETGFRFLGLDRTAASRFALGSGILFKGLTFATKGEVVLDFQFDIGRGLKLETNFSLGVNPDDVTQVRKADVGIGLVGHF
ncbi:MAG TPA: DUF4157 domain-containing protein [Chthoniobacterales bacterium]